MKPANLKAIQDDVNSSMLEQVCEAGMPRKPHVPYKPPANATSVTKDKQEVQ